MSGESTIIETTTADGPMAVVRTTPSTVTGRVLILQDAPGIRPSLHAVASELAARGYDVAIPDLWHRHGRLIGYEVADVVADPSRRQHVMEMLATFDDVAIDMDVDAAISAIGWDERPFATIGFCMGARGVHHTMRRRGEQVVAGAMWHPSFLADDGAGSPHLSVGEIGAPLWIGIGTDDQIQSIEMHRPYFDAVESLDHVTVEIFDGADHGYTFPASPNHHRVAATASWAATTVMFATAFDGAP